MEKTLNNTTADQAKDQIPDIEFWGDGDMFKLLSKASSKKEGWMKSTKAMEIPGVGCVVQVTTQQDLYDHEKINYFHSAIAEGLAWVPGVRIEDIHEAPDDSPCISARRLVAIKETDGDTETVRLKNALLDCMEWFEGNHDGDFRTELIKRIRGLLSTPAPPR